MSVNAEYIRSASMDDAFRTEPPFKLQGSYRNMNKLAEKIVPVMNEDELESLIEDHYQGEAQTLTTGAEHNLLKLAELRGRRFFAYVHFREPHFPYDPEPPFDTRWGPDGPIPKAARRDMGFFREINQRRQPFSEATGS